MIRRKKDGWPARWAKIRSEPPRRPSRTDYLASLGAPAYSFYRVQPNGTLVPIRELRADVTLFNLLAVPASKRDRLA